MTDHDTFRWGDTETKSLLAFDKAAGENGFSQSRQLLNAKWERPCVWRLMLTVAYNVVPGDAGLTFNVNIFLQVGVGQASQLVPLASIAVVATNPPTVIPALFFDVPAEAMQVQFFVGNFGNSPDPGDSITVTAMCAPHAEPGAIAQTRDTFVPDPHASTDRDREGMPHWMPEGFDDGRLRYRY
jgi:hypothetical protein